MNSAQVLRKALADLHEAGIDVRSIVMKAQSLVNLSEAIQGDGGFLMQAHFKTVNFDVTEMGIVPCGILHPVTHEIVDIECWRKGE